MRNPIWRPDEITERPEPDGDGIWFYGLVLDDHGMRLHLAEIFPGVGYSYAPPRTPGDLWAALKDVWRATR